MKNPGISVIICCYNSKDLLVPTLTHLANQKGTEHLLWEVVLVDNASTDGTGVYATEVWQSLNSAVKIKVIAEANPGLINARITGLNHSSYDYAIFCDDDNWLDSGYVKNALRIITSDANIGICGGYGQAEYAIGKPEWLSTNIASGYALGPQADIIEGPVGDKRFFLYGAGMVVRKSLIKTIYNDFNHSDLLLSGRKGKTLAAGDDSAICFFVLMMGHQLWYSSHLKFKHFLSEKRLSKDYTARMYEGFGASSAHIKLYFSYLPQASWFKKKIYSHWVTNLILQLITVFEDLFFTKNKDRYFKVKMQLANLKEIIFNRTGLQIKREILNKIYLR